MKKRDLLLLGVILADAEEIARMNAVFVAAGRIRERAAVVAYLRKRAEDLRRASKDMVGLRSAAISLREAADEIEEGKHRD